MDPEYERWLRNDVAYLHSLWHRGPPPHARPPPPPAPPLPQHFRPSNYIPPSQLLHYTSNPTQFKNKPKKKKSQKTSKHQSVIQAQNPIQSPSSSSSPSSGIDWPCSNPTSTSSPATISGWSITWPQPDSQTRLPSSAEKATFLAAQAQAKSLKSVKEFFESDDDNDSEDDEDEDDDLMEKEQYRFFLEVFMEDRELREYYEKNYSDGEFSCLLCLALKKRYSRRKYKDCAALVQHTISVSKKRMGRAHRAYGQAICKVLGWDIAKLPKIVSALSVKCERSLTNLGQGSNVEDRGKNEDAKAEAQVSVGEGREDGLSGLERTEDQMNVSNSGQNEENVCEGTSDALTSFQSKEGSVNVADSGQREVQSDGQANISEGNYHDLTDIGNKEAIVDISDGGFPVKEFVDTTNFLSNGESVVSENSLARPEASKSPADLSQAVPEIMENKEAGQLNGGFS